MKKIWILKYFALLICGLASFELVAKDFQGIRSFSLGIGNLNRFPNTAQIDEDGNTKSFDVHPYLGLGFFYDFNKHLAIYPEFIISTPRRGRDKKIKTNQYYLNVNGVWKFYRHFNFQLGLGWSFYRISSDGGVQTLNNGPGETDFPMPEESSTAMNVLINSALEYSWTVFSHPVSAKSQLMIYNAFESETRDYAYTLSLHYHFKSIEWLEFYK